MDKFQNNQHGFSVVEASLIIVIIGLIGAVGWYVHNSLQHVNNAYSSVYQTSGSSPPKFTRVEKKQTTNNQTTQQPAQRYMDIKEWGVHLTLNDATSSLYYYIDPQYPDIAFLSLKTISDIAPGCGASNGALGAMSRLTETQQQQAVAAQPSSLDVPGTIHIGAYWYAYEHTHAGCGTPSQNAEISQSYPAWNVLTVGSVFNTLAADPIPN